MLFVVKLSDNFVYWFIVEPMHLVSSVLAGLCPLVLAHLCLTD